MFSNLKSSQMSFLAIALAIAVATLFEYLCFRSMAAIHFLILSVRGPILDIRI